ncbi:MAG: HAD family hydrolase [Alkaliphilus sp.]
MSFKNIKVIIFDLDGTLYRDTKHFDYYANKIKEKLDNDVQEKYLTEYHQAVAGSHVVKIGSVYDSKLDLVLYLDDLTVVKGYDWNNNKIDSSYIKEHYQEPIVIDMDRFMCIGDLWWVPSSIGKHYGLTGEDTYDAFLKTRDYMMTNSYAIEPIEGLADVIKSIKEKVDIVLMTNSPEPDSMVIIEKLGLSGVFPTRIFNANKPVKTLERLDSICSKFNVEPSNILSIGDNLLNEITPIRKLGGKTIFIDFHDIASEDNADIVVTHLEDSFDILKTLG